MGRVKLNIRRLENSTGRQSTYSKRKNGIIKKADELAVLCDIDIALLMFSPTGKPALYEGKKSTIEDIIEKFAELAPQERTKRKLESLEALRKTFKKVDHDVNIQEYIGPSYQSVEDLITHVKLLRSQLSEIQERLSYWSNLDNINSVEHLGQMETSLNESLNKIQMHKENLQKQEQLSMQCANEFQDEMHLPFRLGIDSQLQPLSWTANDNQHMVLSSDLTLLPERETEWTAGTSFDNFSGYFDAGNRLDITKIGQENGTPNELRQAECLNLQPSYEQQPHQPYISLLCGKNVEPAAQMGMQENNLEFLLDGRFELSQFGNDPCHHSWDPLSGACAVASFDEHTFPQQHYSSGDHMVTNLDHMFVKDTHPSSLTN